MKRLTVILSTILFALLGIPQSSFGQTYNKDGFWHKSPPGELEQCYMVELENSGHNCVKIDRPNNEITFYSIDHSVYKIVSYSFDSTSNTAPSFLYVSKKLFELDDKIEYVYVGSPDTTFFTKRISEDSTGLLSALDVDPLVTLTIHNQKYPIYNTADRTKLILNRADSTVRVYSLPGTLTSIDGYMNEKMMNNNFFGSLKTFPNPTNDMILIEYELPKVVDKGEIILRNSEGKEIKRYKVDQTQNNLKINTSDYAAGVYFYSLQTSLGNTSGMKVVILK